MESLKTLAEVTESDARQKLFVALDLSTGSTRPFTLEDFHRVAESIRLHPGVPENVRSHFETARNLILYSWFFYPFNVMAQLSAYITVEFALRARFSDRKTSFKQLIKTAIDAGLISDKGFSIRVRKTQAARQCNDRLPAEFQIPEPALLREYSDVLAKSIPFLRNELAHGTTMLHGNGAGPVRICAELINQLFPSPAMPRS